MRNFRVWLDTNANARRPLPSSEELSTYDVIVTSTNRRGPRHVSPARPRHVSLAPPRVTRPATCHRLTREQKKEGERSALRQVISADYDHDLGDGLL